MTARPAGHRKGKHTGGVLPPADLNELLDVGDFLRHGGRLRRDGVTLSWKEVVRFGMEDYFAFTRASTSGRDVWDLGLGFSERGNP